VLYLKVAPTRKPPSSSIPAKLLRPDRPLLEVFVTNIAACFRNVKLVERLLHAQQETEKQRSFLKTVIDADLHLIYVKDRQGQIVLANQGLAKRFGLAPEQMVGRTFSDLITDPEFAQTLLDGDEDILAQAQDRVEREAKFVDPAGQTRWVYTVKVPIKNEVDEIEKLLGVGVDITERKRAEEALFEEKERAQVTLHSIGDAVITADAHGVVEYLNPVAEALSGWTTAEARGRPLNEVFRIVSEQSRQPAPDPVARCLQEGKVVGLANHSVLIGRDEQEYHIDDSAAPIRGRDGRILGAVLVFHDVTENRQLARQLEHDATHDALTGLINRPEFERRLARALASAQRYGARHALCYLDLDHFKIVNDTAGHAAGDELLRQINTVLAGMFRERDALARIGGDEFGLLLDNCPLERAQIVSPKPWSITSTSTASTGRICAYQIGVSIGLVPITPESQDTTQLLTQADVACYIAKEAGPQSRPPLSTGRHRDGASATAKFWARPACATPGTGRFRLHYQPIVPLIGSDHRRCALRGAAPRRAQSSPVRKQRTGVARSFHSGRRTLRADGRHRPLGDSGGVSRVRRRHRPDRRPDRHQFIR
jgi:diguanylate cyclase (GGDEF)-like protein/PAS domain S-box-containing protein